MKLLKELVAGRTLVEREGRWVIFLMFIFSRFCKTCSVTVEEPWAVPWMDVDIYVPLLPFFNSAVLSSLDVARLGLDGLDAKLLGRKASANRLPRALGTKTDRMGNHSYFSYSPHYGIYGCARRSPSRRQQ